MTYKCPIQAEKERVAKLKSKITELTDYATAVEELRALENYLKFVDDEHVLESLLEYYSELAQEVSSKHR